MKVWKLCLRLLKADSKMRILTCDPQTEIIGQTVLSFVDNVQADEIQPYLVKYGLEHIQPELWYPAKKQLDMMNDMAREVNLSSNLVAIGMAIVEKMLLPPEMETAPLANILLGWDGLYHMQHRGGEIGYVKTERISDTHYTTTHRHIYPDDMTYGLAYGMARRWLPSTTRFTVKYDENIPNRDNGGDVTVIHVEW
jgi:hypothetical protein